METAGRAVVFSGVTVAIGLLALIVLPVPFMRSMGYGGALIPLASVLTTLSFTPAILGGIGPRVDWPKIRHENRASRSWSRWARGVVQQPLDRGRVAALAIARRAGRRASSASRSARPRRPRWPHSGQAYDALQTLETGRRPDRRADPDRGPGRSPTQAPAVAAAVAQGRRRRPACSCPPAPASNRSGQTVIVAIPDDETVNSKSVGVVRDVKDVLDGHGRASSASPASARRRSTSCTRSTATSR